MKGIMGYEDALAIAEKVKAVLAPGCKRIEVAGSLRRRKPEIGDIELVAIPKMAPVMNFFGDTVAERSLVDDILAANYRVLRGNNKYKKLDLGVIECDLFLQPDPRTWGMNFMIRTGCAEFAKWMVTERRKGGAMPSYMYSAEAMLFDGAHLIPTPEEEDVFREMGLKWIPPEERVMGFWNQVGRYACLS